MKARTPIAFLLGVLPLVAAERVPPIGMQLPPADKDALVAGVTQLAAELAKVPPAHPLLPEAKIFHKSVNWAVSYQEFYRSNEVPVAHKLI